MSIPPLVVTAARRGWKWQWHQLMNGLGPADKNGNYLRPPSQHQKALVPKTNDLLKRSPDLRPRLIVGRSCPWAHRTWLVYELRDLSSSITLLVSKADHKAGRWKIDPKWLGCDSLLDLYKLCGTKPNQRATVPTLIDPKGSTEMKPRLLGNESAQLVEALNEWPTLQQNAPNLYPKKLKADIEGWQNLLQPNVNDGVYRCGFARTQGAYDKASNALFNALHEVERSLSQKGPWLCGEELTIADIRLFPTLIRWEAVYMPLFGCTKEPLWSLPNLWEWRKKILAIPKIAKTCDPSAWRNDYFGALFPLHPSNIIPAGPDLMGMIGHTPQNSQ